MLKNDGINLPLGWLAVVGITASLLLIGFAPNVTAYANWSDASPRVMLQGGISQQADPLPPPVHKLVKLQADQSGGRGFLGLELKIQARCNPLVLTVFSGSPAERVGIVPGDELLSSQGQQLFDRSASEVDWALPDAIGQPVQLVVRHGNRIRLVQLRVAPVYNAG